MTFAFVSFINRRDYDESSSSSSSSSLASSQKKNYSKYANEYIILLIKKWKSLNLQDTNLWVTFRDDFEEWTEQNFKITTNDVLRSLRNFLRKQSVWISRQKRKTIARSLQEMLEKETETPWTEKKIMNSLNEKFESSKIIRLIKTNFERNSRDYSWQTSSRSEPRRTSIRQSSKSRESSFRDRSLKERSVEERSFQQSSMRHLSRESFIARNFLRQSSSSSSSSKVQEISSSEISEISENLYNDSSSSFSFKNLYIRQSSSKKESMLRQSFQSSRFSKFYQSSQLSEQFYRRSTEYSSFVSSRLLSHEYSSLVSSRSFASSSLSMNQSIRSTKYDQELVNLTKLYSDETKYSEENDNFFFKLIMFNDMCDRIDVLFETKLKAFFTMLKKLALNYYYANVTNSKNASFTFDDVCIAMMNYFEDAEYKRSILNKWNNLTLKSIMSKTENKRKSINECLQLLIKDYVICSTISNRHFESMTLFIIS
jgi:hypothetical protein